MCKKSILFTAVITLAVMATGGMASADDAVVVAKPAIITDNFGPASTETKSAVEDDLRAQIAERQDYRDFLKGELASLEEELGECEKTKKKWKVATVLGSIGVAATGAAAIGQAVKQKNFINEHKETEAK